MPILNPIFLSTLCTGSLLASSNLMPDASFESGAPLFFQPSKGSLCSLLKVESPTAAEGKKVFELSFWNRAGSAVVSPLIKGEGGGYELVFSARLLGVEQALPLKLSIYDAEGQQELQQIALEKISPGESWQVIRAKLEPPTGDFRWALVPGAESGTARLQIDKVGLFQGAATTVTDNADWQYVEAAKLAREPAWVAKDHFRSWYHGLPFGGKMLNGGSSVNSVGNAPAAAEFTVRHPGRQRLWVRLLSSANLDGEFTLTVRQNGTERAVFECNTKASGDEHLKQYRWVWRSFSVELEEGPATVEIGRPNSAASNLARNINALLLTNLEAYQPDIYDFFPRVYVRWTNTGEGEPYCLYTFVHRNEEPWFGTAGILAKYGFTKGYAVPAEWAMRIGPGESTSWSDLSPYLLPAGAYNRVSFLATRIDHATPMSNERWKGRLEFSVGTPGNLVHTVEVDQTAPRVLMTIPGEMSRADARILSARDHQATAAAALAAIPSTTGKQARHLQISAALTVARNTDPDDLANGEYSSLAKLGFNSIQAIDQIRSQYESPGAFATTLEKFGILPQYGTWSGALYLKAAGDPLRPDVQRMDEVYAKIRDANEGFVDRISRIKLADEPGAPSYEALRESPYAQEEFRKFLQEEGVSLEEAGVADWSKVLPVTYQQATGQPVLFYYTGVFRLKMLARQTREAVEAKKRCLPGTAKTHINYSPRLAWVEWGADPFYLQREGGLEMGWSEDWMGYHASPQNISDTYAILRAAGRGQPMGGYMVAADGPIDIQRIKYYADVAGGVRHVSVYKYGPAYNSIDSWSEQYGKYATISALNHEMGIIDEALQGTIRRPTRIAMLYNRTASIWAETNATSELDVRFQRWALCHAGYDADIIAEEDIEAGELDRYHVLYMGGIQLRSKTAQKIADWVRKGGVLAGSAGAGSRDEFNRPTAALNEVFGIASSDIKIEEEAGRPRHDIPRLQALGRFVSKTPDFSGLAIKQFCYKESITPLSQSKVILSGGSKAIGGVHNRYGTGHAIRLAALPGIAYFHSAITASGLTSDTFFFDRYDERLRSLMAFPAKLANAPLVASSNLKSAEVVRYDGNGRTVLFVINYGEPGEQKVTLELPDAGEKMRGYATSGAPVSLQKLGSGKMTISTTLPAAGAVVLE